MRRHSDIALIIFSAFSETFLLFCRKCHRGRAGFISIPACKFIAFGRFGSFGNERTQFLLKEYGLVITYFIIIERINKLYVIAVSCIIEIQFAVP